MDLPPFLFLAFEILMLLLSSSYSQPATSIPHTNITDLASLLAFKSHVTDPQGILHSNWTTNTSFCNWNGITCSHRNHQRVTGLNLTSISLQGTISPHLANLSFLSYLDLSNNTLTGSIPQSLGQLPRLNLLALNINSLTDVIPPTIFNMSSLIAVHFHQNNLTGLLPSNHSHIMLPKLQVFSAGSNQLTGKIPSSFAQCRNLQALYLYENEFTGAIPTELGNLFELTEVYFESNQLNEEIPTFFGNLTNLSVLNLRSNKLEGQIPKELENLMNLQTVNLAENTLTGPIPTALLNSSKLNVVELNENSLSGPVPATKSSLACLHLAGNQFTGGLDFITSLSNSRKLQRLSISNNKLTGVLPDSIGNLSNYLTDFDAEMNYIQGIVPPTIGNLSGLLFLNLGNNELTGLIPIELTKMKRLQRMYLHGNRLNGSIPFGMGLMKNLGILDLHKNQLSGAIPGSLANISGLQELQLFSNKFSSSIPQVLWNLEELIYLSLAKNDLHGPLSSQVGDLKSLTYLDLSNNHLSGNITSYLNKLTELTYLDLSSNSFEGGIPQSLGDLINIQLINLSHNSLSDGIPQSLAIPRYLNSLDLSYNKLEGQVPEGRVFSNLNNVSIVGNAALCGATKLSLSPCPETADSLDSKRKLHLLKYIFIPFGSLLVLVVCCILLLTFRRRSRVKTPTTKIDSQSRTELRMISYHELITATENFNAANLIGKGGFGSVYKARLNDGVIAAIKVLNLDLQGALKSFEAECQALSMLRHRNLVKIINICSNFDFKALILQFMPNGSLEGWLHSDTFYLNLLQRINIMLDVSLALEYLHHHHYHVVVHCDIKPSNVLLDEEMTAHLGDFGIAKLFLGDSGYAISTSALGTIGYMAPEYGSTGQVSRRGDVYSFGILILETFTRKKPTDSMFNGELSLRKWVENAYSTTMLDIVDENLLRDDPLNAKDPANIQECLSSIMELGLLCSSDSPKERILMKDVVPKLQKIKMEYLQKFPST